MAKTTTSYPIVTMWGHVGQFVRTVRRTINHIRESSVWIQTKTTTCPVQWQKGQTWDHMTLINANPCTLLQKSFNRKLNGDTCWQTCALTPESRCRSSNTGASALHWWEGGERAPPRLHVSGMHQVHKWGGRLKHTQLLHLFYFNQPLFVCKYKIDAVFLYSLYSVKVTVQCPGTYSECNNNRNTL